MDPFSDTVYLRGLNAELCVGPDAWDREGKPQPVIISVEIQPNPNLEAAASGDDVSKTLDYGKLYKELCRKLGSQEFKHLGVLAEAISRCLPGGNNYKIEVAMPKAALRSSINYTFSARRASAAAEFETIEEMTLDNIRCACIIGVNAHERLQKQIVDLSLVFQQKNFKQLIYEPNIDTAHGTRKIIPLSGYRDLTKAVAQRVEGSAYQTVEALASSIAQTVTMDFGFEAVTVSVEKPNAIASIDVAGVRLHRRKSFFAKKALWSVESP